MRIVRDISLTKIPILESIPKTQYVTNSNRKEAHNATKTT